MNPRETLCLLLARHKDQVLTQALAVQMVRELFPDRSHDPAKFGQQVYRGLTFQAERFCDIEAEIHPLHAAHWVETERFRHGTPMNPNYEGFKEAEHAGTLIQFTARDVAGVLVGNARFYLYQDAHTQTMEAREDTYYLMPHVRAGFAAIRFWQFAEQCLRAIGVCGISTDSKVLHDEHGNVIRNVGRLNEYLGYTHVASKYHKRFKE